ncbi:hypothetical protein QQP08_009297 [Theobroma cacao]|nr:hypothetical protein QQP08_009297 [Theobroma cacao]
MIIFLAGNSLYSVIEELDKSTVAQAGSFCKGFTWTINLKKSSRMQLAYKKAMKANIKGADFVERSSDNSIRYLVPYNSTSLSKSVQSEVC